MPMSQPRRAGILLLVVWLTADVAAFGICGGDRLTASPISATVSTAHDSDATPCCCTWHHCFCCSSGAEVITFTLPVEEQAAILTPPPDPHAPVTAVAHSSPPPRL